MAATSPKKSTFTPGLEAAHDRTYEAGDRLAEVSRKLATAYLDGIEKYVADFAKLEPSSASRPSSTQLAA